MKADPVDAVGQAAYWLGFCALTGVLVIVLASANPSRYNHSAVFYILISCDLLAFAIGGFTHLGDRGLNRKNSRKSLP